MGGGFSYTNMVKVVPNYGEKTCSFKLENASNTTKLHENYIFLTRETDVGTAGSLFMRACPDVGGTHATFELMCGGTVGSTQAHILRCYPEGLSSTGVGNPHIALGDNRALKVQIQGGKVAAKGQTAHLQGGLHTEMIDCDKLDVGHIDIGDSTGEVRIGHGLTKDVHIDIGGGVVSCGTGYLHLGSKGHIRCSGAATVATGNVGTNIVNTGHTGYIGTGSLIAIGKTGLRGSSCIVTTLLATGKNYAAPNEAAAADGKYVVASCIEGPHAAIFIRGQVHLKAHDAKINLDTARIHAGVGNALLVPHQVEDGWTQGTFGAMFQNPTVHVSNAGIWKGVTVSPPNTLTFLPDFTTVHGKIVLTGAPGAQQAILEIQSNPTGGTPDIVVNYIVTAERKDAGYLTNHFMKDHINPYTGTKKTCGGEHTESHLDNLLGAGSWSGK